MSETTNTKQLVAMPLGTNFAFPLIENDDSKWIIVTSAFFKNHKEYDKGKNKEEFLQSVSGEIRRQLVGNDCPEGVQIWELS